MPPPLHDIVIVGAGVAGLTTARELRGLGHAPVVLERSRGVGGRCATRRMDDLRLDHGVAFLHGQSAAFIDALGRTTATRLDGWPMRTEGDGTPCRPAAFGPHERRVAFAEGVNRFAKDLAAGTDVRLEAQVTALGGVTEPDGAWPLALADGGTVRARTLVLALPPPNIRDLLATAVPLPPRVADLLPLLALVPMVPCLAVLARYPVGTPMPPWQMAYPQDSPAILLVSHESSKRPADGVVSLVIQARASWSRTRTETPGAEWAPLLLAEAGRLYGTWAAQPASFQTHAWRKARVSPGCELTQPLLVQLESGALLGCAGDGFDPAGGVEGAYLSGRRLAARIDAQLRRPHSFVQ